MYWSHFIFMQELVRQALIQGPSSATVAYIFLPRMLLVQIQPLHPQQDFPYSILCTFFLPHYATISYVPASGTSVLYLLEVECVFDVELHKQQRRHTETTPRLQALQGTSRCKQRSGSFPSLWLSTFFCRLHRLLVAQNRNLLISLPDLTSVEHQECRFTMTALKKKKHIK